MQSPGAKCLEGPQKPEETLHVCIILGLQPSSVMTRASHLQALGTVHIPDATPESELSQVLAILGALAAENDKSTLLAVLQGLSPQVLADCVIANMAHLPAANTIVGTGSSSGLAGLMQVGCWLCSLQRFPD